MRWGRAPQVWDGNSGGNNDGGYVVPNDFEGTKQQFEKLFDDIDKEGNQEAPKGNEQLGDFLTKLPKTSATIMMPMFLVKIRADTYKSLHTNMMVLQLKKPLKNLIVWIVLLSPQIQSSKQH